MEMKFELKPIQKNKPPKRPRIRKKNNFKITENQKKQYEKKKKRYLKHINPEIRQKKASELLLKITTPCENMLDLDIQELGFELMIFRNYIFNDDINKLFEAYPQFKKDYILLLIIGYMEETKTGLHWLRSKKSLAEYFTHLRKDESYYVKWALIEKVFKTTGIKQILWNSHYYSDKLSKDFEYLQNDIDKKRNEVFSQILEKCRNNTSKVNIEDIEILLKYLFYGLKHFDT